MHDFGGAFNAVEERIAFHNSMGLDKRDQFALDVSGGGGRVEEIFFPLATIFQEISCTLNVLESEIRGIHWNDLHVIACMH